MILAIIGSRNLNMKISEYMPTGITEIISGGAKGIDTLAEIYANKNNIPMRIIRPEYNKYKKAAPLKRNYCRDVRYDFSFLGRKKPWN